MGIEKKVYSFRFDSDMVESLMVYADKENRTLSNMVETIIKNYLSEKEQTECKK